MTIQDSKDTGLNGLDLGTNPTKTNHLLVADGVRFEEAGSVITRPGRSLVNLDFPYEGYGTASDYEEHIQGLKPGASRGMGAMYDQRITTTQSEILADGNFTNENQEDAWALSQTSDATMTQHPVEGYLRFYIAPGVGPGPWIPALDGTGTAEQVLADMASPLLPNTKYLLRYAVHVVSNEVDIPPTLTLLSTGPIANVPMNSTSGSWQVEFTTGAAPTSIKFYFYAIDIQFFPVDIHLTTVSIFPVDEESPAVERIPQRLNVLWKEAGTIHFNKKNDEAVSAPHSENVLEDDRTQAKFLVNGTNVIVVDESSVPRILRRKPLREQNFLKRTEYQWGKMGIKWPVATTPRPNVRPGYVSDAAFPQFLTGTYRFRICLVDKWGNFSSPSLPIQLYVPPSPSYNGKTGVEVFYIYWNHMIGSWEQEVDDPKVNIYQSFAAGVFAEETPSAYRLIASVPWDNVLGVDTGGISYTLSLNRMSQQAPYWEPSNGHPPRLADGIMVNDTFYGIAMPDIIHREVTLSQQDRSGGGLSYGGGQVPRHGDIQSVLLPDYVTAVKEIQVDSSFFFFGEAGLLSSLQHWVRIGRGSEIGVGLAQAGSDVVVFTNQAVYVWDVSDRAMRRVHSKVGCAARDSIQETEQGIRFMGSDGIPRLFNGATVEEVSNEIRPLFRKADYRGYYQSYDGRYPRSISSAYGQGTYYLNYPTTANPGGTPKPEIPDVDPDNFDLATAREVGESLKWSIDTQSAYRHLNWLGRESRLFAVDADGFAYYIDETVGDAVAVEVSPGVVTAGQRAIDMTMRWRWISGARGLEAHFFRLRLDVNTRGFDLLVTVTVDQDNDLSASFTINTDKRDAIDTTLPPHFKGRFLELTISGSFLSTGNDKRPEFFDFFVETEQRGEF